MFFFSREICAKPPVKSWQLRLGENAGPESRGTGCAVSRGKRGFERNYDSDMRTLRKWRRQEVGNSDGGHKEPPNRASFMYNICR